MSDTLFPDEEPEPFKPWQRPETELEKAKRARDKAMANVADHADDDWKVRALAAVTIVAEAAEYLIANDARALVSDPREPRAWGPVMMRARKLGILEPTNEYRPIPRVSRHAAPVRVWHSLVYRGAQ